MLFLNAAATAVAACTGVALSGTPRTLGNDRK